MELRRLLLQGPQLRLLALPRALGLRQRLLELGLSGFLGGDGRILGRDGLSGVLGKCLIGGLRTLLGPHGLGLHCRGVVHQLLQHGHHAEALAVGLVVLEPPRRLRLDCAALHEGTLVVELSQHLQSLLQEGCGLPLLLNHLLELCVLLLTVLARQLQLLLHLRDLALQRLHLALGLLQVDGLLLGKQGLLAAGLVLALQLRLTELRDAEVLLLHLVLLLLLQRKDHVIHGLLDVGELVELHLHGQGHQARILGLGQAGGRAQSAGGDL
mmetsp:Transcript_130313/g.309214  ORF Transcript_130313/g.309214 Transcript_130313/m.309214 type:complete len:269 (+) Transcript_130313:143-949(+)